MFTMIKTFIPMEELPDLLLLCLMMKGKLFLVNSIYGDLVDEFQSNLKCCAGGLTIVVLQFAKLSIVQGSILVQGVDRITKILVNPDAAEVINFKNALLLYLGRSTNYGGIVSSKTRSFLSNTLDFLKRYPVKSIAELNSDPELGVFIVNARMIDIISLDPWWYPTCKCGEIFESYIGVFHCAKCNLKHFKVAPNEANYCFGR
ncbi:hypothetical protein TSUD_188820 [Trifolium subterraneum]|uniref:Replication factor A C-terminal domain-containing protein n=1 Tax=Trifolium subterraneum TaxID=3900 RepID=A0A2Z6NUY9_TRISU|nr:hypothetical protein TSUD_188820 [Trifolium subterraneum]